MATLGADQVQLVVRVLDATHNMQYKKILALAMARQIQLAPIRQGQRGQVAEWVVLIAQGASGGDLFGQPTEQIVGVLKLFFRDPKLLADPGRCRSMLSNRSPSS